MGGGLSTDGSDLVTVVSGNDSSTVFLVNKLCADFEHYYS